MPSTTFLGAPGASRYAPAWHVAQFNPTRGIQSSLLVAPIGRSLDAVSYVKPTRSQPVPGRVGSLSAKTSGRTLHTQYGTPTVSSVPIDPYLNSVSMSLD
jgi:hypothetical protein